MTAFSKFEEGKLFRRPVTGSGGLLTHLLQRQFQRHARSQRLYKFLFASQRVDCCLGEIRLKPVPDLVHPSQPHIPKPERQRVQHPVIVQRRNHLLFLVEQILLTPVQSIFGGLGGGTFRLRFLNNRFEGAQRLKKSGLFHRRRAIF